MCYYSWFWFEAVANKVLQLQFLDQLELILVQKI
jgi:hypothetical protein